MTRFDAADPEDRRALVAEAIRATRERGGPFATITADGGEPWVQYADGRLNLDCTDAELERLRGLLAEFPAFTVAEMTEPEEADGTNVRVETQTGPERVAQFVERVFLEVYERPEDVRIWATEI